MEIGVAAERAIATVVGGPANIEGGETGPAVEVTLEPGEYVVVCWLLSAGSTPHAYLGMFEDLSVVGEADDAPSPGSDGTFELSEYQIQVPKDFDGTGRFDVVNRGTEWHELVFLEIDEAQNPEEALAHLTGVKESFPPSFMSRGGTGALEVSGGSATVDLDLDPGRYLIVCAVPTAAEINHANLGMWTSIIVP